MSWTLCSSDSAIAKAGEYANATIIADTTEMAAFSDQSEGTVCMKTRRDWITTAGGTQIMNAVEDAVSTHIAIKIINYNMDGFTSRAEAQTMLNVLKDSFDDIIKDLREANNQVLNK